MNSADKHAKLLATGYTAAKPCYCCVDPPPTLRCAVVHGDTEEELAQVDLVISVGPLRSEDVCTEIGTRLVRVRLRVRIGVRVRVRMSAPRAAPAWLGLGLGLELGLTLTLTAAQAAPG